MAVDPSAAADAAATGQAPSDLPTGVRRRGSAALLGLAVALVLAAIALLLTAGDEAPGTAATDRPFTTFDGEERTFADYEGRPLVVNFWASTCAPCIKEMPAFEEVHQEIGDTVAFLGMDVQERVEEGMPMVETTGVTYDLASDFEGFILQETAPFPALPTTAFIDAEGTIVDTHTGALTADELRAKIDELLAP